MFIDEPPPALHQPSQNGTHMENLTIRDGVAEASTASGGQRSKRQHSPNAIQIEELDNGKPITSAPANLISAAVVDERRFRIVDGYLDPNSNYTGFIEVIGEFFSDNIIFQYS